MNFVNCLLESSQLLLVANCVAISADEELTGSVKLSVMYDFLPSISISTHLTTSSVCEKDLPTSQGYLYTVKHKEYKFQLGSYIDAIAVRRQSVQARPSVVTLRLLIE